MSSEPGTADTVTPDTPPAFDPQAVRAEFPVLERTVHGKPLIYLDSAASTQKPRCVIEAIRRFYEEEYSNVHRGLHLLSARATEEFEDARCRVQKFLGAAHAREIVFTSGTTGAINLVAQAWGDRFVGNGDEIVVTEMEHHSNIVPWQLLCERSGSVLRVVPIDDDGDLVLEELERILGPRTRMLALTHTSNALGTRNPLERIVPMARALGIPVLIDAAQAAAHETIDVRALDCDFLAMSGHKVYGPTGIGVLYGKSEMLEQMPPYQGGGEMIHSVTFAKTTYKEPPQRFEAGTPNIAGAYGLGAAVDFLERHGLPAIGAHEQELLAYADRRLGEIPEVVLIGTARQKASIVSFRVDGVHPHDVGTVLDLEGIAVRAGHHCAQPVMDRYGLPATVRASLACYNTRDDVDRLADGIRKVIEVFG